MIYFQLAVGSREGLNICWLSTSYTSHHQWVSHDQTYDSIAEYNLRKNAVESCFFCIYIVLTDPRFTSSAPSEYPHSHQTRTTSTAAQAKNKIHHPTSNTCLDYHARSSYQSHPTSTTQITTQTLKSIPSKIQHPKQPHKILTSLPSNIQYLRSTEADVLNQIPNSKWPPGNSQATKQPTSCTPTTQSVSDARPSARTIAQRLVDGRLISRLRTRRKLCAISVWICYCKGFEEGRGKRRGGYNVLKEERGGRGG